MNKEQILKMYEEPTKQTYKNQPLFVGDVYKNELGTMGIVLLDDEGYFYQKTSGVIHRLPSDKAGMSNSEFVANVVQDEQLMQIFIDCNIITNCTTTANTTVNTTVEETEQKPKKKVTKKKEDNTIMANNIYQKINNIRKKWAETEVEKEGKGKLGSVGKFNYYKPQQIIDFCLKAELEQNLYSKFTVDTENKTCCYQIINLDNPSEIEDVACPFEIPKKMVVNEAQQTGAALTYFNRRLAMMIYKIEDNSKESVDVLASVAENNAPEIPAPPIETIQEPSPAPVPIPDPIPNPIPAPQTPPQTPQQQEPQDDVPPWLKPIVAPKPQTPQTQEQQPPQTPQTPINNSIESLY